jgi:hypothetical protein
MSNYPPDPGGVFASDVHRRVAAHLPVAAEEPISVEDLLVRLQEDVYTQISDADRVALESVLTQLAASGHVKELKAGWRLTKAGLDCLTGPALTQLTVVDGESVLVEPPPLEGAALEEAESQQARIRDEDLEIEQRGKVERVKNAEDELAAALAAVEEEE